MGSFIVELLEFLIWAAAAGIAFLAWQKGKVFAWLLVLVGGGIKALMWFLAMIGVLGFRGWEALVWLNLIGDGIVVYGLYLIAMPLIKERLAKLKSQIAPPQSPSS